MLDEIGEIFSIDFRRTSCIQANSIRVNIHGLGVAMGISYPSGFAGGFA